MIGYLYSCYDNMSHDMNKIVNMILNMNQRYMNVTCLCKTG